MGKLWELELPVCGTGTSKMMGPGKWAFEVHPDAGSPDFFRVNGVASVIVSESARKWLAAVVPEYVLLEKPARGSSSK